MSDAKKKINKAFRFRLYPTKEQENRIYNIIELNNVLWNELLRQELYLYKKNNKFTNKYDKVKYITRLRNGMVLIHRYYNKYNYHWWNKISKWSLNILAYSYWNKKRELNLNQAIKEIELVFKNYKSYDFESISEDFQRGVDLFKNVSSYRFSRLNLE